MKKYAVLVLAAIMAFAVLAACGKKNEGAQSSQQLSQQPQPSAEQTQIKDANDPIVTIEMADGNKIQVELYPDVAPNTVKNFISLVQKGFYDGLIFHRVIPGFMIQGGDPQGSGMGGPGYTIKGEFTANGFQNDLKHTRGVISMARTQAPDSAGSQFFIMVADAPSLDGQYAAFGKVVSGLDEADAIVNVKRDQNDRPNEDQVMKQVTVDTKGKDYGAPETIAANS